MINDQWSINNSFWGRYHLRSQEQWTLPDDDWLEKSIALPNSTHYQLSRLKDQRIFFTKFMDFGQFCLLKTKSRDKIKFQD